jgi:hypothetical protein
MTFRSQPTRRGSCRESRPQPARAAHDCRWTFQSAICAMGSKCRI